MGDRVARPLVLLDVDGVINDLQSLQGWKVEHEIYVLESETHGHRYRVHIPTYMPALIKHIASIAEVIWCTTWRGFANDAIAPHLGIGPLRWIDDGTDRRVTDWKGANAWPVLAEARSKGRPAYWIEDFDMLLPDVPKGVRLIDTSPRFVLLPQHLPPELREVSHHG
jgi:hypothetical protein